MSITEVAFLEGRLLSSQSNQFKKLWLAEKSWPSKKATFFGHPKKPPFLDM